MLPNASEHIIMILSQSPLMRTSYLSLQLLHPCRPKFALVGLCGSLKQTWPGESVQSVSKCHCLRMYMHKNFLCALNFEGSADYIYIVSGPGRF